MPDDANEPKPLVDPEDAERSDIEEVPGHTPGTAEGEDDSVPRSAHPYPDPDKTPGNAEG